MTVVSAPRITRLVSRRPQPPTPPDEPPQAAPAAPLPPNPETDAVGLITPAAAAAKLSVTAKVLERWRATGCGPAFVQLTRKTIRYTQSDLAAYIAGCTRSAAAAA